MFILRFDLRAPSQGTPAAQLYAAAVDMAAWADEHGCLTVAVSEHHGSPDGYLPSPMVLAAAVAARTRRVPIQVAALLATLHSPVKMAEDMAVLDILSGGRVSYVLGLGYRQDEYDLFEVPRAQRVRRLEDAVHLLRRAWSGAPVGAGRGVPVTPTPLTPGGPVLLMGGGTEAAARRAARLGLGMVTERAGLADVYQQACRQHGTEPGPFLEAPADAVTAAFVSEDPDREWERLAPHVLHDMRTYARWNDEAGKPAPTSVSHASSVDELRAAGYPYRVFTPGEAVEHIRAHGYLALHPLCGGAHPDLGWSTLHLLADRVLPAL